MGACSPEPPRQRACRCSGHVIAQCQRLLQQLHRFFLGLPTTTSGTPKCTAMVKGWLTPAWTTAQHATSRRTWWRRSPSRWAGCLWTVCPVQNVVEVIANSYVFCERLEDLIVIAKCSRQWVHVVLLKGGLWRLGGRRGRKDENVSNSRIVWSAKIVIHARRWEPLVWRKLVVEEPQRTIWFQWH